MARNLKTHQLKRTNNEKKAPLSSVHCDAIRGEGAGGRLILESAEEVLGPDIVELGVVLERVHDTLALDGVGALEVEVVGEEQLLGAVELPAAALGLLGAVVPAHPHPHAAAAVSLHLLHPRHVRLVVRVRRPHQHAVAHFPAGTLQRRQIPRRKTHTHARTGANRAGAEGGKLPRTTLLVPRIVYESTSFLPCFVFAMAVKRGFGGGGTLALAEEKWGPERKRGRGVFAAGETGRRAV